MGIALQLVGLGEEGILSCLELGQSGCLGFELCL